MHVKNYLSQRVVFDEFVGMRCRSDCVCHVHYICRRTLLTLTIYLLASNKVLLIRRVMKRLYQDFIVLG